jgi:hypothetical protein
MRQIHDHVILQSEIIEHWDLCFTIQCLRSGLHHRYLGSHLEQNLHESVRTLVVKPKLHLDKIVVIKLQQLVLQRSLHH